MSPGTDTAGSGHGRITTPTAANIFSHNDKEQIDILQKHVNSFCSVVESNSYASICFICL